MRIKVLEGCWLLETHVSVDDNPYGRRRIITTIDSSDKHMLIYLSLVQWNFGTGTTVLFNDSESPQQ